MNSTTTEPVGRLTSFTQLFDQQEAQQTVKVIEIPMIQRDYAQGRRTLKVERIREDFIHALCNALKSDGDPIELDFIFGDLEPDGKLMPLDGQQRLTALFLLHCYLGWRGGEKISGFPWARFNYATRPAARDFCQFLTVCQPDFGNPLSLSEWLGDQANYLPTWEYDPTIQSMLVVLDALNAWFTNHPDVTPVDAWKKVTDATQPAIRFHFLPLKALGLTDVQYIKMNSRGKPLTPFENFKAQFEEMLSHVHPDAAREFADKIDTDWSDIFWVYVNKGENEEGDHLIDDKFLRYFCFVSELRAWDTGASLESSGAPEDLAYLDRMAEEIYGKGADKSKENLVFLCNALNVWKGRRVKDSFEGILTDDPQQAAGRLLMFNAFDEEGVDLLHACSRHYGSGKWSYAHTLLFYGVLLHFISPEERERECDFARRLRVLRNLIAASPNEIRLENMPRLLSDVRVLILEADIEGVGAFNQAQKENELEKIGMLAGAGQLRQEVNCLEDHELLQGGLMAFELEPVRFQMRAEAFHRLFRGSISERQWIDVTGALLAHGDYSRTSTRWTEYFFVELGAPSRKEPWQKLFRGRGTRNTPHPMCRPLMSLLDAGAGSRSLQDEINGYVNATWTSMDWRYYLVKYPVMRYGESGNYVFDTKRYEACMTRSDSGVRGYYYDPYLWAIVEESGIPPEAIANRNWPRSFSGYENDPRWLFLNNSRLKLRSVDAGWEVLGIPQDPLLQIACRNALQGYKVSPLEDGKILVEVSKHGFFDAEDRIQVGASLLKRLYDSGL